MSRAVLLCEAFLILVVFNASSFFRTTVYARSITLIGVLLTLALMVWIWIASGLFWGYGRGELGLQARSVYQSQWRVLALLVFSLYLVAFLSEFFWPSEFEGSVTLSRVVVTAAFTLTFGPVFEELLFRGYFFRRIQDVACGGILDLKLLQVSFASIFSGLLFGLWHLPTPILVLYFHDPLAKTYAGLSAFVFTASLSGILLGEIRRRTGSILPGVILHFYANSIYVLTLA